MERRSHQLPIPGPADADPDAIEMLRVWAAGGKQHVSIDPGLWKDPASWGMMLVDLAKHIANAYDQTKQMDRVTALARLKEGFDAEWGHPTDVPSGIL